MAIKDALRVALPVPVRRTFDYKLSSSAAGVVAGCRVLVPLRKRSVVGVVCAARVRTDLSARKLKTVSRVLDQEAVFSEPLFRLLLWAAEYYQHPVGEILHVALPVVLRRGRPLQPARSRHWQITAQGIEALQTLAKRSVVQRRLLESLKAAASDGLGDGDVRFLANRAQPALARLVSRGWVVSTESDDHPLLDAAQSTRPRLNDAQSQAVARINASLGGHTTHLLHGVTGAGKTEVYLRSVAEAVSRGGQVMVLVPEIALTPQLVERFQHGLTGKLVVLHSGLGSRQRHRAWWAARQGAADVVLGTRSAVFTPLERPALIIVDEEHDASYKQQDGFRYNARDIAVKRAQQEKIPVLLGSATPALETLENTRRGRYRLLALTQRAGGSAMPRVHLVDLKSVPVHNGLSAPVVKALAGRLERGEQSIVYVNRRGFAPVVLCSDCGWQGKCRRCDASLTLHQASGRLRCHHCGAARSAPVSCPACGQQGLYHVGEGTQRVEGELSRIFPAARVLRLDSDSTAGKGRLEQALLTIHSGQADIVVGTQMLSKGHHFAGVTLVCVLNTDRGLFSFDFRASERLFQQLTQVAGRAGRGSRQGDVVVQTMFPEALSYVQLNRHDFDGFATACLAERRAAGYPPYAQFVLLRAEAHQQEPPMRFLTSAATTARRWLNQHPLPGIRLMEPVPSPMERRAGRFRAQLLVSGTRRGSLGEFLRHWLAELETLRLAGRVRWSVDVDPLDLY
ncbi:MAG: primosomal protein N' [Pseudomonadota bacterium]|nr:primosomal protein N' [Pseudomonadota bacterium]